MGEAEKKTMMTPSPKLSPNQQYLNLMFNSLYRFTEIICNDSPDVARMKITLLAPMMISYVINKKEKERLKAERFARLKEIEEDKKLTTEQSSNKKFEVNCETISEIVSMLDDAIGVVERQVIMETIPISPLEKYFFPDGDYSSLVTKNDANMPELEMSSGGFDDEGEDV